MCEIAIFGKQLLEIGVAEGFLAMSLRNVFSIEQSCLSDENCFHLQWVVSVSSYGNERNLACPSFKDIAVDAEAEAACECFEIGIFPVSVALCDPLRDEFRLLLQTFHAECVQPCMDVDGWECFDSLSAWWVAVISEERLIVLLHGLRDGQA